MSDVRAFAPLWLSALWLAAASPAPQMEVAGDVQHVHDPALAREAGRWVLFSTGPGILVRASGDLKTWRLLGSALPAVPAWALEKVPGARDLWAPDIAWWQGRWLLYYSVSRFGTRRSVIGLATSSTLNPDTPGHPWRDEGLVVESSDSVDWNAIDPHFAVDEQGAPWLAFGSYWGGIKLVRLNPRTCKPLEGAPLRTLAARPEAKAVEAPYLLRREGWHYLFASYDHCCRGASSTYKIRVGRSRRIGGPYRDRQGRLLTENGGTLVVQGEARWRGPGHCAVVRDGSRDLLVYHAYDAGQNGVPTLRIAQLRWDAQGWPSVPAPPAPPFRSARGSWEQVVNEGSANMIHLLPGGHINTPDSRDTWTENGLDLELRWPREEAPGGAWIDRVRMTPDRRFFRGSNQNGARILGRHVAE